MKKFKFPIYGLFIGGMCAVYGSAIFSLLLVIGFYGMDIFQANPIDMFMGVIVATLFSVMYSILPGALGGAYLAWWLEKSERAQREIVQQSLFVGVAAGVLASVLTVVHFYQFSVDASVFGYALLATVVAAGMSWFGSRILAKDKKKLNKETGAEKLAEEYIQPRMENEELK